MLTLAPSPQNRQNDDNVHRLLVNCLVGLTRNFLASQICLLFVYSLGKVGCRCRINRDSTGIPYETICSGNSLTGLLSVYLLPFALFSLSFNFKGCLIYISIQFLPTFINEIELLCFKGITQFSDKLLGGQNTPVDEDCKSNL